MIVCRDVYKRQQYQEIELFDKPGLFSNGRIVRDNLPEGVYCYDLRGSDYDPGEPVCVEERVVVNHAGSAVSYTHLDVYKRQAYDPCPAERHAVRRHSFRQYGGCLLYTSRCV